MLDEIIAALRAPSFQQDSKWHHPKANYATKPRDLLDAAAAELEALAQSNRRLRETMTSIREVAEIQTRTTKPETVLHRLFNRMVEDIDAALKDNGHG